MEWHRQCLLERGNQNLVSWIPEVFAVPGKFLRLEPEGDGWKVKQIGGRLPSELVSIRSRDYKKQRVGSDI